MIRSLIRALRLGMKAEPIVLAYEAWGVGEDEALARWRADLARMLNPTGPTTYGEFYTQAKRQAARDPLLRSFVEGLPLPDARDRE